MNNTVRLIYPQWQGGHISHHIPEIKDPADSSRGYYLGAELLNFLAPKTNQKTITVPISLDMTNREPIEGVIDRDIILKQTKNALNLLDRNNPDKIVTLGGECSVSVAPFTYLADKYKNDVAVIWIDAHPDINLPNDHYMAYHAMAVTALIGEGDKKIMSELPAKISPDKILFVGLRDWGKKEIKQRQKKYGIKHLTTDDIKENSGKVIEWMKSIKVSKILIHLDMDVLDPTEIIAAVGIVPNGMKIDETVRLIGDISKEKEIVGLTIAEPMPRNAIRLRNMLKQLPLMK